MKIMIKPRDQYSHLLEAMQRTKFIEDFIKYLPKEGIIIDPRDY